VPGLPGGVADAVEAAILAGECGTRAGWALSGDVRFSDLPLDAILGAGGFDNLDLGALLAKLGPMLSRFRSSVVRDIQFELHPTPRDETGDPVFDDNSYFSVVNHVFDGVPLGFNFAVRVPPLPRFRNDFMEGVVVLGGADVPGRGLVPLGLGAGVNTAEPVDDQVDLQGDLPAAGLVLTRMAPTHHGLEGSRYVLGTVAVSLKFLDDASVGVALSGVFERMPENRLRFDPDGDQPVPLATPFLNAPDGVRYNFLDTPQGELAGRSFRAVGSDLSAASIVRIQFTDRAGRRWQVITHPDTAAFGFILPKPPEGLPDRTFHTGDIAGERSELTVQALRLRREDASINFQQLVEFNGNNADRLGEWMVAVSALDQGRPEISWETSVPANNTLTKEKPLTLEVRGARVGTGPSDVVVKINFSGGIGCETEIITINQDPEADGKLSATLPAGCTGSGVVMAAQLYDNQGQTALAPPVRSVFRPVNIQ
jgi:hypothetical protein